jgi:endonuclease YncB( thermonuclease family)
MKSQLRCARTGVPILLALLMCAWASAETITGTVVRISDGDSLHIKHGDETVKIRLYGVDCPESDQPYGLAAKRFTARHVERKTVTVELGDTDRYGRRVGTVMLTDGRNLNQLLVEQGYAWWYEAYAKKDVELARLQSEARAAERGLWAEDDPIAPWDWRKRSREEKNSAKGGGVSFKDLLTKLGLWKEKKPSTSSSTKSTGLYRTKTGTKYHRATCGFLKNQRFATTIVEAQKLGLGPCAVCKPPK